MDLGKEFATSAAAFLGATRTGDMQRAQQCVMRMHADLDRFIRRTVRARAPSGQAFSRANEDDIVQDVLRKLLESPPTRAAEHTSAGVTLLAWVKTVTVNHLINLYRRKHASVSLDGEDTLTERLIEPVLPTVPDRLESADELAWIDRILAERYPRGREMFAVQCADPDLSDAEIADRLQTTPANVYKIRHRIRAVLAEHLSELAPPSRL